MVRNIHSVFLLVCVTFLVIISSPENGAEADVYIGSCNALTTTNNYIPHCEDECRRQGFKGGHCGSFLRVNCWCEQ
ncbi:defensin [Bemisia tabaci]